MPNLTSKCVPGLLLAGVWLLGCSGEANVPAEGNPTTKEEAIRQFEQAQREAALLPPPQSVIQLPTLEGWVKSEPKSLPAEDRGFTIAYDHPSGITVTLYQFTRGYSSIPQDLKSPQLLQEMFQAKQGITGLVELGFYESAKEIASGAVTLGQSPTKSLWSKYALTRDGRTVQSEIYIWSHPSAMFKLRCSSPLSEGELEPILRPLLTALGNATRPQ